MILAKELNPKQAEEMQKEVEANTKVYEASEQNRVESEMRYKDLQQRLQQQEKEIEHLDLSLANFEQLLELQASLESKISLAEQSLKLDDSLNNIVSIVKDCELASNTAQSNLKKLEQQSIAHQAAALANLLEVGQPCPVCGSVDHTKPAVIDTDEVNDSALQAAKSKLEQAMIDLYKAQSTETTLLESQNELGLRLKQEK